MTDAIPPGPPPASPLPAPRPLARADLAAALAAGWRDFRAAPGFGLFFGAAFAAGGIVIYLALASAGRIWWAVPVTVGFPILAPFAAVGLYEVSRRLEAGQRPRPAEVLAVVWRQKDRQIPSMSAVIVVFFLFWMFLGHMIFALFLGLSAMTNITSSFDVYLTANGLMMLAVGTIVGAIFAGVLFSLTVVSLPLLLDREVDFISAMIASVGVVLHNPGTMLLWGAGIGAALFVAMAPAFLGLVVVLPVLGHASWHLYRRALP
ncbi:MAG: DUF2189 domain-containing protein, partial [Rhodobacteraceae bacterium]|nr:DUF2189 domain-containing protein [Paracoccaceae bacterium]